MKQLKFIKFVNHVQIGHVYEHLYCSALSTYLRSEKLYSYTDYYMDAKTYYSGLVVIDVNLYSDAALKVIDKIDKIVPKFSDDQVGGAITQVLAEKVADIDALDVDVVRTVLQKYQAQPWVSINDTPTVTNPHRLSRKGLTLIERSPRQFMILEQNITLDTRFANKNRKSYLPLFAVISRVLEDNLREEIMDSSYCFSYDNSSNYTSKVVKETNVYRIDKRHSAKLTSETDITTDLVKQMYDDDIIHRIYNYLQNATYALPFMAPDVDEIYKKTRVMVGDKGWKEIGTVENISDVLRHVTIDFKLGSTKQEVHISTFLYK